MKYAYHFHAMWKTPSGMPHMDGVYTTDEEVNSYETYFEFKAKAARDRGVEVDDLIVCSFTPLLVHSVTQTPPSTNTPPKPAADMKR